MNSHLGEKEIRQMGRTQQRSEYRRRSEMWLGRCYEKPELNKLFCYLHLLSVFMKLERLIPLCAPGKGALAWKMVLFSLAWHWQKKLNTLAS